MRFLAALLLCLVPLSSVAAKPAPYRSDTFSGDRYVSLAQSNTTARDVTNSVRCPPPACQRKRTKAKYLYRTKKPAKRQIAPLTLAKGFKREVARAMPSFARGRLVCAENVGRALAARGIKGTGSRLAKSYLAWGRKSPPVPGAVAVFSRRGGGHVAIVHSVTPSGQVIYLNPSSRRQAWVIGPYRRQPIAYRVAS